MMGAFDSHSSRRLELCEPNRYNGTMSAVGPDPWLVRFEARLAAVLADEVGADGPTLEAVARHLALAPAAKRIRPRFSFLCAQIAGADPASVVDSAVAVELIHAASLLHDDIVDHAEMRRGRPSANAVYGDGTALLAGDALLARALTLCAPALVPHAARTLEQMARAAYLEVRVRGKADTSPAECLTIADGKTAALFALAARAAHESLAGAGRALGRAFQLADDLADLAPDAKQPSELANDLVERTPTLPLALSEPAVRAEVAALWTRADGAPRDVPATDAAPLELRADAIALAARVRASGGPRAEAVGRAALGELESTLAPFASAPAASTVLSLGRALFA
jgi:geranylgeranyl pyrophosphate synthase